MNRPGGTLAGPGRLPGGGGDAGQCSHRRWRWCLRNAAHEQGERRPAACQRAGAHATAAPKLQRRRGTPGAPMPGAPAAGGGAGAPGCSRVRQGSPRARLVAQLVGGPLVCGQLQRARARRQRGQEAPPHNGGRSVGRRCGAHAAHEAPREHLCLQPRWRRGRRRQHGAQLCRAPLLLGPQPAPSGRRACCTHSLAHMMHSAVHERRAAWQARSGPGLDAGLSAGAPPGRRPGRAWPTRATRRVASRKRRARSARSLPSGEP